MVLGRDAEAVPLIEAALGDLEGIQADDALADLALAAARAGDPDRAESLLGDMSRTLNTPNYLEARRQLESA